ncbi:MAG TPA: rhomboid family intramembrane serine protease [Gemmatimonadales bacterium]|nr:rhomboid family intramembrane serine protease [Gemmatimonadales bacterium]
MTDSADHHPVPVVTFTLLALCWVMALLTLPGGEDTLLLRLYHFGAKDNASIASGEYWRLLTAAFLHGGIVHILINSWSLYQLGALLEPVLGRSRFLATYLISAVTGSLSSWAFNSAIGVGASGAIFGLLGSALYLSWRGKSARIPPTALNSLVLWTIYNLVYGFITPTIDNAAHMGGLVGGLLCAMLLRGVLVPWAVIGAGTATLAWGGYEVARTPDRMSEAAAFIEAEQADEKGDTVAARVALAKAPDFAPALLSGAFFRLRESDNKGALELADSALRILADSGPRGRASRRAASAIGIENRLLLGRAHLFRAWALFGMNLLDEGIIDASIARTSPERYTKVRASLLLGQAYLQKQKFEDALSAYRDATAAEEAGVRGEAWFGAAAALDHLGRTAEALTEIDKAIAADSSDHRYTEFRTELQGRPH